MIRSLLLLVALGFVLAGCANYVAQDRRVLEVHGVPGDLSAKILRHDPVTLEEIIVLSQKGVPGPFIVHFLKPTGYDYALNYTDAARLQKAGVSEDVIHYLTATRGGGSSTSQAGMYPTDPVFTEFPGSYLHN